MTSLSNGIWPRNLECSRATAEPASPSVRRRHLRDQPHAALEGDVIPQPGERHDEAVADLDQEIDVHQAPEQPAEEAGELEPAELHHGRMAADGREIALVAIVERRPQRP